MFRIGHRDLGILNRPPGRVQNRIGGDST